MFLHLYICNDERRKMTQRFALARQASLKVYENGKRKLLNKGGLTRFDDRSMPTKAEEDDFCLRFSAYRNQENIELSTGLLEN